MKGISPPFFFLAIHLLVIEGFLHGTSDTGTLEYKSEPIRNKCPHLLVSLHSACGLPVRFLVRSCVSLKCAFMDSFFLEWPPGGSVPLRNKGNNCSLNECFVSWEEGQHQLEFLHTPLHRADSRTCTLSRQELSLCCLGLLGVRPEGTEADVDRV